MNNKTEHTINEDLLDIAYTMIPYIEDLIDMDPSHHCYKVDSLREIKKRILKTISQAESELKKIVEVK